MDRIPAAWRWSTGETTIPPHSVGDNQTLALIEAGLAVGPYIRKILVKDMMGDEPGRPDEGINNATPGSIH